MDLPSPDTPPLSVQPWRQRADGHVVLLATRLAGRDALHFPPLPATSPLGEGARTIELAGTPTLYSFTIVHSSPKAGKPPRPLGLVDFPEGVRVFGPLDMPASRRPVIGEALQVALHATEDGPIYAFRPLTEQDPA